MRTDRPVPSRTMTAAAAALLSLPALLLAQPAAAQSADTATVTLSTRVITAGQSVGAVVRGAPGRQIDLFGYSRPSTTYKVLRTGTLDENGQVSFSLMPQTNTRVYAAVRGGSNGPSTTVNVAPALSIAARGSGQSVTFTGGMRPARPGLLVGIYRLNSDGSRVLTGRTRISSNGTYSYARTFTGKGRFAFRAETGADVVNNAGISRPVTITIGQVTTMALTTTSVAGVAVGTAASTAESQLRSKLGSPTATRSVGCEITGVTGRHLDYGSAVSVVLSDSESDRQSLSGWIVRRGTAKHPVTLPYGVRVGTSVSDARSRIPGATVQESVFGWILTTDQAPEMIWFLDGESSPGPVGVIALNPIFCE